MDKEMLRYLNGESNVFEGRLKITRDIAPNGMEYIRICLTDGDDEKEIYTYWRNPQADKKNKENPKHTGGKKPYLMLMIEEVTKLRKKKVPNIAELVGFLVCLGENIEWNTGRLMNKRSKKSLQYKDLLEIYGCSKPKFNKMLGLMRNHDLLYHTNEGYFISPKLIKKGRMKEDNRDV